MAVASMPGRNVSVGVSHFDGLVLSGAERSQMEQQYMLGQFHGEVASSEEWNFDYILHRIIVPVVFTVFVVIGTLGNALVIQVILSRPQLRTVTNILLLNLAIADISFLSVCGGFSIIHHALTVWPFSDTLCRIIQYLLYVTCYVTVYTLVTVSVIRYLSVVYGPQHVILRSKRYVVAIISLLWLIFLIAKIPILLVHGVSANPYTGGTECIISGRVDGQRLFASFFVFAYALPLASICTLYCLILHSIKIKAAASVKPTGDDHTRRVSKIVVVVVAQFAGCWLPLHVHLLISYYGHVPESQAYSVCVIIWYCLVYLNSVLNPVIYNAFCTDFRQAFKQVILCVKPTEVPVAV